jgi:hypothetical protein
MTVTESVRFVFFEVREMLTQMIQRFKKIMARPRLVQLARLHDQGVADAVINYMQQTYLEAVRREEAISENPPASKENES